MNATVDQDAYRAALLRALDERGVAPDEINVRADATPGGLVELHTAIQAFGTVSYTACTLTGDDADDLDALAQAVTAGMEWQHQPRPFAMDETLLGDDGEPLVWGDAAL